MRPAEKVEVETSQGHDGVVGVLLNWKCKLGDAVVEELEAVVVGGFDRGEEERTVSLSVARSAMDVAYELDVRGGEQRHILNVGVVFLMLQSA